MGQQQNDADDRSHVIREEPEREHRTAGDDAGYADGECKLLKGQRYSRRQVLTGVPRRLRHKTANGPLEAALLDVSCPLVL